MLSAVPDKSTHFAKKSYQCVTICLWFAHSLMCSQKFHFCFLQCQTSPLILQNILPVCDHLLVPLSHSMSNMTSDLGRNLLLLTDDFALPISFSTAFCNVKSCVYLSMCFNQLNANVTPSPVICTTHSFEIYFHTTHSFFNLYLHLQILPPLGLGLPVSLSCSWKDCISPALFFTGYWTLFLISVFLCIILFHNIPSCGLSASSCDSWKEGGIVFITSSCYIASQVEGCQQALVIHGRRAALFLSHHLAT